MVASFSEAAKALGTTRFYHRLLDAIGTLIDWELRGAMLYSRFSIPHYLISDGIPKEQLKLYFSGMYRFDPYFRYWRERGKAGVVTLREACLPDDPHDEKYRDYFTSFLLGTGLVDDIAVFCPTIGGGAITLFFDKKAFLTKEEIDAVNEVYPLVAALHLANERSMIDEIVRGSSQQELVRERAFLIADQDGKQVLASERWGQLVGGDAKISDAFQRLRAQPALLSEEFPGGVLSVENLGQGFYINPGARIFTIDQEKLASRPLRLEETLERLYGTIMTPKERAIVRLIFAGYPSIEIASRLNITVGNLKNHRKRMFRKLDITTERELFLKLLTHIEEPNSGRI